MPDGIPVTLPADYRPKQARTGPPTRSVPGTDQSRSRRHDRLARCRLPPMREASTAWWIPPCDGARPS